MILDIMETKIKIDLETKRMVDMIKNKYNKDVRLDVILASDDEASKRYVRNKQILAEKLGIKTYTHKYDKRYREIAIMKQIKRLNCDDTVNGIMIQSPVYEYLDEDNLMNTISQIKDVDGLSYNNMSKLYNTKHTTPFNDDVNIPCTPLGLILYITENKINFIDKNVVIIGRSKLVGEPLQKLLRNITNCNVTMLHSKTSRENMIKYFNIADIVISAVGKNNFTITSDMFEHGKKVTIFDIGIRFDQNGKIIGDCDKSLYDDKYITVTKTPNGTAQLTLSGLMRNTVIAAKKQYDKLANNI